MRRVAVTLALASVAVLSTASAPARADDSAFSFGVGVLGAYGGNFLAKPGDTTYTLNGASVSDPYPGFSGTTSGFGGTLEARFLGMLGLEIDVIQMSGKGTGDVTINGYGYGAEIDTKALHVPVLVKGVLPLPLIAPFAFVGRELVNVSSTSASETANPGTPAAYSVAVSAKGDNYGMWVFGVGAEIKLPIPAIDIRIPITFRGGYNPSVSDKLQDRVEYQVVGNRIVAKTFDATWQWQALGTVGAQIWF